MQEGDASAAIVGLGGMTAIHFASISGGADSLATALLARERAERTGMDLRLINADLGANEHQITHDYIGYLEQKLGMPIQRVRADFSAEFAVRRETIQHHWSREKRRKEHTKECKARAKVMTFKARKALCKCPERVSPPVRQDVIDRAKALLVPTGEPFLDLCMLKGRFPSRTAQFCTEHLKLEPINAVVHPLLEAGNHVVSWLGEMAEESDRRAQKQLIERIRWPSLGGSLILYRPIHKWTKTDNFALAKRHGILPNKLYQMGMGRVGCFCVNQGKDEIRQWDKRAPEVIDRIRSWEQIVAMVSRGQAATFFAPMLGSVPNGIDEVVSWAKTTRGGKQFDIFQALAKADAEQVGLMCESAFGLCE